MTVQELIDKLESIPDKEWPVRLRGDCWCCDTWSATDIEVGPNWVGIE